MQLQPRVRCGFHLLRNFLLDTIALVNLFGLSLAFRFLHRHNTRFYHQVSKVFYRSVVWLPSGICHRSMPSYDSKAGLFGLIRGVLPIFSQVSALFNQELYTSCRLLSLAGTKPWLSRTSSGGWRGRTLLVQITYCLLCPFFALELFLHSFMI